MIGPMIQLMATISHDETGYTITIYMGGIVMYSQDGISTRIGAQMISAKRMEEIALQNPSNN